MQWTRALARTALGTAAKSPFVQVTKARSVKVKLNRKVLYELDGGARRKTKSFKVNVFMYEESLRFLSIARIASA